MAEGDGAGAHRAMAHHLAVISLDMGVFRPGGPDAP
ncbi:hypothetical protein T8T21_18255 (plasmid) [Limimaricola variabilis]|nr:hypothetical protein [Limimaricola variabilis]WPY96622.1 hypothetical protein T8T21_18255 [Limimaricola variabilis]